MLATNDADGFDPAFLPPSLRKRFYEPIILLDVLGSIYKNNVVKEPDLESDAGKPLQQQYFVFLNKLAQICDSQKGELGKTCSAIVILDSGTLEYRLASNRRDEYELSTTREYLKGILNDLRKASDSEIKQSDAKEAIFSGILLKVLAFTRPRLEYYLNKLSSNLEFCIDYAARYGNEEGGRVSKALEKLRPHIEAALTSPPSRGDEFARHVEPLLRTINRHHRSTLDHYMRQRPREIDSPWSDVRHALGRLLSYFIAIKVLIVARSNWPRLFEDFDVTTIPSTEPQDDPPDVRRTAKGILQRMSNKSNLDVNMSHARTLESQNIDKLISKRVRADRFHPIVHAETNLLASVLRSQSMPDQEGDAGPLRFFNQAEFGMYIGVSKPSCKLCKLYFDAHPSGVKCRDTHGNLYPNWRAPDLEDPRLASDRNQILERMVKDVRNQVDNALRDHSYAGRRNDSRDTPTNPLFDTARGSRFSEVDSMVSRMATLGLASVQGGSVTSSVSRPLRAQAQINDSASTTGQADDDDDRDSNVTSNVDRFLWAKAQVFGSASTTGQADDKDDRDGSRETTPQPVTPKREVIVENDSEDDSRETTPQPVAPKRKVIVESDSEDDDDDDDDRKGGALL